jgi:NAD(P)H-dependent FMN reductase
MQMDTPITVVVICGTKRVGRQSFAAAQWVAEQGRKLEGVEIIFVDPEDVSLPPDGAPEDGRDTTYREVTARADAFFIVTPEYNHSFPSSLKRILDSEYDNYNRKPVAMAGVSNGPWGGTRVCEALLPVLRSLGLAVIRPTVYFTKVQDIFDESGAMHADYADRYQHSVKGAYDELLWFARALQAGREG